MMKGTESNSLQEEKEKLIRNVKKSVKHLMEESVTKKCVHEQSSNVSAVCSSVESCLQLGLRRRSLGLFKTNCSSALLSKIGKECPDAAVVIKRLEELEKMNKSGSFNASNTSSGSESSRSFSFKSSHSLDTAANSASSKSGRFYWIKISLFEKKLQRIISFLVINADRFYEAEISIVGDPELGPILSSLMVGPCALEFTKLTTDNYWSDPSAGELVQRHRISSSGNSTPNKGSLKKTLSSQISEIDNQRRGSTPVQAREYVESLHQDSHQALLYGKNNVSVFHSDWPHPQLGYLSLHQIGRTVLLKWTPNSLMDGCGSVNILPGSRKASPNSGISWQQAISINLATVLYIHCHQDPPPKMTDNGHEALEDDATTGSGHLVCVGVDGVQHPHLSFPPGDNIMTFLGCLESALYPSAFLSPPVKDTPVQNSRKLGTNIPFRKKSKEPENLSQDLQRQLSGKDCVFKIVYKQTHKAGNLFNQAQRGQNVCVQDCYGECDQKVSSSSNGSSSSSGDWWLSNIFNMNKKDSSCSSDTNLEEEQKMDDDIDEELDEARSLTARYVQRSPTVPIKGLCHTMRRQIISRAFYGWLSYCKHVNIVRKHLKDIQLLDIPEPSQSYSEGLTVDNWRHYNDKDLLGEEETIAELHSKVYYGGIDQSIRREVWPYLLGHIKFGQSKTEISKLESELQSSYEHKLSEWGALEAIVIQHDREVTAAGIAKLAAIEDDVEDEVDSDAENHGSYPHSPTPDNDRPSTITEVTEYSSAEKRTSVSSSEDSSSDQVCGLKEKRNMTPKTSWRSKISASDEGIEDINEDCSSLSCSSHMSTLQIATTFNGYKVTTPSIDSGNQDNSSPPDNPVFLETEKLIARCIGRSSEVDLEDGVSTDPDMSLLTVSTYPETDLLMPVPVSTCPSPASSEGGVYTSELMDAFSLNLHRIDKDVARCDRGLDYFMEQSNLDTLRNIVTTYVWEHLDVGYMQGMCDIVAPLLVVIDDEVTVYSCFTKLMERMIQNFPTGNQMDHNFANMRVLMQVLDQNLYDNIQQNGDFSHFYFCYRWFLLDFKREFSYPTVYSLVGTYRDIIIDRNMDFTDIIKFFNEMAEKHNEEEILETARDMVAQLKQISLDT